MTKPSNKAKPITEFLDGMSKQAFGRTRTVSIKGDVCVICARPATEFEDELSAKEYAISGMCQTCQNRVFQEPAS